MSTPRWQNVAEDRMKVSVAIELLDAFTERRVRRADVRADGTTKEMIRSQSGYFVLTDLGASDAPIAIDIDAGPDFLPRRLDVDEDDLSEQPVEKLVVLDPSPGYQFPPTTLVRGQVTDGGAPLEGATLDIDTAGGDPDFTASGRSDARGEYVLFVSRVTEDDVIDEYEDGTDRDGKPLVHVDDKQPTVRATHPETEAETSSDVVLVEGETVRLDLSF